jgi:hypothetical protein
VAAWVEGVAVCVGVDCAWPQSKPTAAAAKAAKPARAQNLPARFFRRAAVEFPRMRCTLFIDLYIELECI